MMPNREYKALKMLKELGYPIKNIRLALHRLTEIDQPQMASMIKCSRQTITHHIAGNRHNPDIQKKIAAVWKIPVNELFANNRKPSRKRRLLKWLKN